MVDKISIRRILGLYGIAAKMDLAWLLRDTKYAIAVIFADLISNLATVSSVFLISVRFGGIGGMSSDEVLFMMAYSTMITGIFIMFGAANNIHVSRIIGRGQLEHMFIQPIPLKVQLATIGFAPFTGGTNFIVGTILMVIAATRVDLHVTPQWVLLLFAFLLATMTTIIARSYLVSSMAFYSPVAAEEISWKAIEGTWLLSTFPLSGMPAFVQIPLITILPEGLMAWFPSLCLLGRPPLGLGVYYPMLYAIILATVAAAIFRKGLYFYVKRGSNRYLPYGFRR
ncbi:MAG: ABC-2 family transporter protein [Oscillospiraceae bacterium]|nr:ABC-2 family transporter protein [Oscillospiraceae bacterium]